MERFSMHGLIRGLTTMCWLAVSAGCGSGGHLGTGAAPVPISVALAVSPVVVIQGGPAVPVPIAIKSTSETAMVLVGSLPAGLQERYAASDTNPSGTLFFQANSTTMPGTYNPIVYVTSAGQSTSVVFVLIVSAKAKA